MKLVVTILAVLAIANLAQAQVATARADIIALSPTEVGLTASADNYVMFTDVGNGNTEVTVHITGIVNNPDADHGLHIHEFGDLSNPTGAALGAHFNPHGIAHGCDGPRSVGDLGNWTAVAGVIQETRVFDLIEMEGVNSIIGRGVVLHNLTDDCATVASSGARLAAGVIGVSKITGNPAKAALLTGAQTAVCVLFPTTSGATAGQSGSLSFQQPDAASAVQVVANLTRLGVYGVHIHQYGDLSDRAAGTNTGSHFDPLNTGVHNWPGVSTDHHAGDMGNTTVEYQIDGHQYFAESFTTMTMFQTAQNESIIGRGFIAHANADDGTSPVGNAGARHAQCVIGIANPALTRVLLQAPAVPMAPSATPVMPPTPSGNANTIIPSLAVFVFAALLAFLF